MLYRAYYLVQVLLVIGPLGCSSGAPYEFLPIHGKVTYEDGSLINADSIVLSFNPESGEREGKMVVPAGQASVNVADGTFGSASSYRSNDGVAPGKHKVAVVAFKSNSPSNAIPVVYRKTSTTPLTVEVNSSNQFIEIKVAKP